LALSLYEKPAGGGIISEDDGTGVGCTVVVMLAVEMDTLGMKVAQRRFHSAWP